MNTHQILSNKLNIEQTELNKKFLHLNNLITALEKLELNASIYEDRIDFDHLSHEDVTKVMLAIGGGKWNKTINYDGVSIDYTCQFSPELSIRCWAGAPPPSCKIIEEVVVVPEHVVPAATKTVRKLQCV